MEGELGEQVGMGKLKQLVETRAGEGPRAGCAEDRRPQGLGGGSRLPKGERMKGSYRTSRTSCCEAVWFLGVQFRPPGLAGQVSLTVGWDRGSSSLNLEGGAPRRRCSL